MATYSKQFLSAGANGVQIPIAATAAPGTTLHTAHATDKDEVFLFACNNSGAEVTLTIEWGANLTVVKLPAQEGDVLVVAGRLCSNSLVVKAFATVANAVNISGYVNRVSP